MVEAIDPLNNSTQILDVNENINSPINKTKVPDSWTQSVIIPALPPAADPPSFPKRLLCNIGIGFFSLVIYQFEWWEAIWFYLFGKQATPSELKQILVDLIENEDTLLTHEALKVYLEGRTLPLRDDAFLTDLLNLNQITPHLHEILKGANVRLYGDQGAYFEKWALFEGAYTRWSSHDTKLGKSRGLAGNLFQEIHFWIDRKTEDTCFQIERHPLVGPLWGLGNALRHVLDWLRYKRDGKQQSSFGTSLHTDKRPIIIDATPS